MSVNCRRTLKSLSSIYAGDPMQIPQGASHGEAPEQVLTGVRTGTGILTATAMIAAGFAGSTSALPSQGHFVHSR